MSSPLRRVRTYVLVILLAAMATAVLAGALMKPAAASVPSIESQLLSLTNHDRARHGLAPLQSSSTLVSIARAWSNHMAATGQLGHNPSLAGQVSGWSSLGENAALASSASQAEALFMSSSGHRANILQPKYNRIGIGVSVGKSGNYWFTVDFEQTSGYHPPDASAPKPVKHTAHTSATSARVVRATRASRSAVRAATPSTRAAMAYPAAAALAARMAAMDARSTADGLVAAGGPDVSPTPLGDGPDRTAVTLIVCGGLAVTLFAGIATARPAVVRNRFRRAAGG